MARKVIMDVDTGSDDAVAIMAAMLSPDIDLKAICTVWGNLDIEHTTDNTLRLVDAMGGDIPVYKGCHTAMVKYLVDDRVPQKRRIALDADGNEIRMHEPELKIPKTDRKPEDMHAVLFYIDYLKNAQEPVTLVAVGPLTNLGHALRIAPEITKNIEEIVIMGGGDKEANITINAEANIWHDPEAAQIILDSGAKVVWVPLDATHAACLTLDDCKKFREINTFPSNFAADLTEGRIAVHNVTQPLDVPNAAAVHDALTVCYVIDPTVLVDLKPVRCFIGLKDLTEGETIIDRREGIIEPNCYFAFSGDRFKFSDMLCEIFKLGKQL